MTIATQNLDSLSMEEVPYAGNLNGEIYGFFREEIKSYHARLFSILEIDSVIMDCKHSEYEFANFLARRAFVGQFFDIDELIVPKHRYKASMAGFDTFIPPPEFWPLTAVLLKIADSLRAATGKPIGIGNYWRPMSYNRMVANSNIMSDHPNACAFDLDLKDQGHVVESAKILKGITMFSNTMSPSVGLGRKTIHIGIFSPKGERSWTYPGYEGPKLF